MLHYPCDQSHPEETLSSGYRLTAVWTDYKEESPAFSWGFPEFSTSLVLKLFIGLTIPLKDNATCLYLLFWISTHLLSKMFLPPPLFFLHERWREVKNRKSSQIHVDGRTETDAVQKSLLFGLAKNISLIIYALIFP